MVLLRLLWRCFLLFGCAEGLLWVRWNFGFRFCLLMLALLSAKHYLFQFLPVTAAHAYVLHAAFFSIVLTLLWRVFSTAGQLRFLVPTLVYVRAYHSGHKILRLIGISQKMTLLVWEPMVTLVFAVMATRTPILLRMHPYWHYFGDERGTLPPLPPMSFPGWYVAAAPILAWLWPMLAAAAFFVNNRHEYAWTAEAAEDGISQAAEELRGPAAPPEPRLEFPHVRIKRSGKAALRTPSVKEVTRQA
jgi:hypothetical protein